MKSVMSHQFSQVPKAEIPRSSFDRSHGYKTTFDAGYLVPIMVQEVLPGDTHSVKASLFGRLATPIKPIMDNLFLETFFFFVPNRLTWEHWAKFNGAQDNPGDSTDYLVPQVSVSASSGTITPLADFMGVPPTTGNLLVNALPFRAYNLIWNEWFRDQNLQSSVTVSLGDGPDGNTDYSLLRRAKRHDYFTSCLPWPQKGEAVPLPGLGTIDIVPNPDATTPNTPTFNADGPNTGLRHVSAQANVEWGTAPGATGIASWDDPALIGVGGSAATINDLRYAFQIQKLLERDARGGTRLQEVVAAHFGVVGDDARLNRPEFLGSGRSMININPVQQNTPTNVVPDVTPQGNLAAYGTVSGDGHGFTKSFTEHGFIIGLVNVRADITYQQGLNRFWSRRTRYDYYWPALAHLGEQEVLSKEIYAEGVPDDDLVFGYQERYAEYRYAPSLITGRFRSAGSTPLDVWHLSQDFDNRPTLSDQFIQDDPPIDRVIAVADEPHFLLDVYFNYRCARPMPTYGTPGYIDRF